MLIFLWGSISILLEQTIIEYFLVTKITLDRVEASWSVPCLSGGGSSPTFGV